MDGAPAELVELAVSTVAHGGVGVARVDGRVVFVSDAIPGERVVAELTDVARASFWRATTVRVLEPSEHRRDHVWSAASVERLPAERAGGAEFGHIALEHQRELKRRVLADSMQRFAGEQTDAVGSSAEVEGVCDGAGWRTRLRLHVDEQGVVGPFAARSHSVVPVAELPLAVPALAELAPLGARLTPGTVVDLVAPSVGDPLVLPGSDSPGDPADPIEITERVGDREFTLDARGFWQVHYRAAQTLSAAVADALDLARFDPAAENLDLYGGVGLLAAALADAVGADARRDLRVTSVESNPRATEHARRNLAEWQGARAVTARVDRYLRDAGKDLSASGSRPRATIVLDPPRSGAGRDVIDSIVRMNPAQVIYVACDPVALARDVGYLKGHGWRLERLRAFDLFPHTHHLEAVALLLPGGEG